jgi:uncharacterized protein (TIGR03086 family)
MAAADTLEQAFASTRKVLANVTDDQLGDPTPCQSWEVRDLVNHIIKGAHWFGESTDAGEGAPEHDADYAAGDRLAAFDEGAKKAVAAFNAPGAQEKMVKLPFGEFPGAVFMGLATTDTFTHGWDLARATRQEAARLDPDLAKQLLIGAKAAIPDEFRGPDGTAPFGPVVDVPESAPPADQLAAFLGRKV